MSITRFQKITLGIAGITALGIGGFILGAPHAFYASYGIELGTDTNLLSELRAPAANLTALGAIMLAGIVRPAWWRVSATVALTVFVAFPVGRIIGLAVDGMPSANVLGALAIEIVIGALCLIAFWRKPSSRATREPLLDPAG